LIGLLLLLLPAVGFAQHGRFTDEILDPGGPPLDPITAVICVISSVLVVTALFRGSNEQNRRAAIKGGWSAFIGSILGSLVGWPVALLFLAGVFGFFLGYAQAPSKRP